MQFIFMFMVAYFSLAFPVFAADARQPDDIAQEIEEVYASFLSTGRSDVMLHMSPAGEGPVSNSIMQADGTILCRISGLEHSNPTDNTARMFFAGVLIHEVTHCRTSPYITIPEGDDWRSTQVRSITILNLESIADAHALIRLAQKNSFEDTRLYMTKVHFMRLRSNLNHATARALREGYSRVAKSETKPKDELEAFKAAVEIGRKAAMEQARMQYGATALDEFAKVEHEFDEGLKRALLAFENGKFDNRMATLHFTDAPFTRGDRHFYIGNDELIKHIPAQGTESAQEAVSKMQE